MHHIELGTAPLDQSCRAQAEGARFGEATGPHGGQFERIDPVADLADMRNPEGVGLPVEIKAGNLGKPDPRIEHLGIGLAGEHLDLVA